LQLTYYDGCRAAEPCAYAGLCLVSAGVGCVGSPLALACCMLLAGGPSFGRGCRRTVRMQHSASTSAHARARHAGADSCRQHDCARSARRPRRLHPKPTLAGAATAALRPARRRPNGTAYAAAPIRDGGWLVGRGLLSRARAVVSASSTRAQVYTSTPEGRGQDRLSRVELRSRAMLARRGVSQQAIDCRLQRRICELLCQATSLVWMQPGAGSPPRGLFTVNTAQVRHMPSAAHAA